MCERTCQTCSGGTNNSCLTCKSNSTLSGTQCFCNSGTLIKNVKFIFTLFLKDIMITEQVPIVQYAIEHV